MSDFYGTGNNAFTNHYKSYNIEDYIISKGRKFTTVTDDGVTFTKLDSNTYLVDGTSTSNSCFCNILQLYDDLSTGFVVSDHIFEIDVECSDNNVIVQQFYMNNGSVVGSSANYIASNTPAYVGYYKSNPYNQILLRLNIQKTVQISNIKVKVSFKENESLDKAPYIRRKLLSYTIDLNDIVDPGTYSFTTNDYSVTNEPFVDASKKGFFLRVEQMTFAFSASKVLPRWIKQTAYSNGTLRTTYERMCILSGGQDIWTDWQRVSGPGLHDRGYLSSGRDLNDYYGPTASGIFGLSDTRTYYNAPVTSGAVLIFSIEDTTYQIAISYAYFVVYKRRKLNAAASWSDWIELSGGGGGNQYTFNNYQNSYDVTATPTITTSTNNYLASTGDTTDRTNDIVTMLETNKVCNLGPGNFYVSGVVMPNSTVIKGSGAAATQLVLIDTVSEGAAISMKRYNQVSDLTISGVSVGTLSSTLGTRHGILWSGNYRETESNTQQPCLGLVSNVRIHDFTGGGITCYNTGYGTYTHISAVNCQIYDCNAGVNINYWSEFHKFTNIRTWGCYYGVINNGGNNVFVSCDVSGCKQAFLMDNSQSQSPNNSHGSAVGCVFNHTDSNSGIGIKVLNCDNGFIFDGCQIFFSQTDIENSEGVVFSNCNYGNSNCDITIVGGGCVLFANNMHGSAPNISITNNTNVHFSNCYVRSTGAVVSN